jgi:hypothetical protein
MVDGVMRNLLNGKSFELEWSGRFRSVLVGEQARCPLIFQPHYLCNALSLHDIALGNVRARFAATMPAAAMSTSSTTHGL